jgi:hypothetical protein
VTLRILHHVVEHGGDPGALAIDGGHDAERMQDIGLGLRRRVKLTAVGAHGDKDRPIQEGGRWLHPGDILTLAALAPETEPGPGYRPSQAEAFSCQRSPERM